MSAPAIRVQNLGKQYAVGSFEQSGGTFYDLLAGGLKAPWRMLRGRGEEPSGQKLFWALRDVSFEVAEGEVVGIIGRNGAGKSTLLKLLSRITAPTAGRIEMRGRLSSLLEVGTGFHPELSGRENIFLNGAILGMSRQEVSRKFDEIVAFAEIDGFVDTPVKRYSSGMYVRLAFSVAAHLDPDILVVDEVLAVGDMQFQKKCLGKLETVARGGRSVLFVSHNLTAIESLCSKAVLLDKGRLVHQGPVREVTEKYIQAARNEVLTRDLGDADGGPAQNGSLRILSVGLADEHGAPLATVSSDAAFRIQVEYRILRPDALGGLTVILEDSRGNIVLTSINNHEPNWYGRPMPAGVYRSSCEVPGQLLNSGWFHLGLNIFGKGFSDPVLVEGILSFEVQDGASVRGDYFGPYGGTLRPLLKWQTHAREAIDG